jgi:hypothetical protein
VARSSKSTLVLGILLAIFLILNQLSKSYFPDLQGPITVITVLAATGFSISLLIFLVIFPYRFFTTRRTFLDDIVDSNTPWGLYVLAFGLAINFLQYIFAGALFLSSGIDISFGSAVGKVIGFIGGASILTGLVLFTDHLRRKAKRKDAAGVDAAESKDSLENQGSEEQKKIYEH